MLNASYPQVQSNQEKPAIQSKNLTIDNRQQIDNYKREKLRVCQERLHFISGEEIQIYIHHCNTL